MLARVPWSPKAKSASPQPRLSKEKHRAIIEAVALILKTGEPTMFAYEASCRHGIRQQLCLEGWSWDLADAVAADIVAEALRLIGAKRPTWQEGQPEWTQQGVLREVREHCARCRKPIPQERIDRSVATPAKYCSMECTDAAKVDMYRIREGEEWRARHRAQEAARLAKLRAAMPPKPCAYCGDMFHPAPARPGRPETTFCSPRCRNKARSRFFVPGKGIRKHPDRRS